MHLISPLLDFFYQVRGDQPCIVFLPFRTFVNSKSDLIVSCFHENWASCVSWKSADSMHQKAAILAVEILFGHPSLITYSIKNINRFMIVAIEAHGLFAFFPIHP